MWLKVFLLVTISVYGSIITRLLYKYEKVEKQDVIKNDYLKIWHCERTQGTTLLVVLAQKKEKEEGGGRKKKKRL